MAVVDSVSQIEINLSTIAVCFVCAYSMLHFSPFPPVPPQLHSFIIDSLFIYTGSLFPPFTSNKFKTMKIGSTFQVARLIGPEMSSPTSQPGQPGQPKHHGKRQTTIQRTCAAQTTSHRIQIKEIVLYNRCT